MRPSQLTTVLDQEFISVDQGHHTPVMIWGPPGIGKSQIVTQIAQKHDAGFIDIRLSQMEPSDLRGIPFRHDDLVEWAVPSLLPSTSHHPPKGILFLDEINAASPTVSAAAYQLILDRRLGDYTVPPGWVIFAAGNRQGDRGVNYTMPAPLANRFSHYELEVNLDDWVLWAWNNKIDERLIGFLRFRPELLFEFDPVQNPIAFPSPRTWEYAHRSLQKFDRRQDLLLETLQSCVGPAAGIELAAFVKNLEQLPDIDKIINGEETTVPSSIDLQYAVASALVGKALKAKGKPEALQVFSRILQYADFFPEKEMAVMLVADMHRMVGKDLFEVAEFTKWAQNIADVMLYE